MKNNITWQEVRMIIAVIFATATIVSSVVLSFSRLDYKLDMVIANQDRSDKELTRHGGEIKDLVLSQATHEVRLTALEAATGPFFVQQR